MKPNKAQIQVTAEKFHSIALKAYQAAGGRASLDPYWKYSKEYHAAYEALAKYHLTELDGARENSRESKQ